MGKGISSPHNPKEMHKQKSLNTPYNIEPFACFSSFKRENGEKSFISHFKIINIPKLLIINPERM
jgi:hypothetical protein